MKDHSNSPIKKQKDPFEPFRVHEIQKEKKELEPFKKQKKKSESSLILFFINFFKKVFDFFLKKSQLNLLEQKKSLLAFKKALEILKQEDRSEDVQFYHLLVHIWHQLIEEAHLLSSKTSFGTQLHLFIQKIWEIQFEKEAYSLGYYLSEELKTDWLPAPYVQLIKNLYEEHLKSPKTSRLFFLSQAINNLLDFNETSF